MRGALISICGDGGGFFVLAAVTANAAIGMEPTGTTTARGQSPCMAASGRCQLRGARKLTLA